MVLGRLQREDALAS